MANIVADTIAKMQGNGTKWHESDEAGKKAVFEQNQALGASIGAKYDSNAGTWDYSGVRAQEAPKQSGVGIPAYTEGRQVSLDPLKKAIGDKPTQNFSMDELKKFTDQAAKYSNPEQFQKLISTMVGVMKPLTDVQKQNAVSGYGSAQQGLDSKWAARGMLASGAAAAQQREGANQLGGQLAGIEAQAQANAVPLAFDAAKLDLSENGQKFGQLATALGMQEDQLQNYLRNLSGVTNMDIGQNQWAQQFGLQRQQSDYNMAMGNAKFDQDVKNSDRNFGLQEGALTGNYVPQELKDLFGSIVGAKQNYGGEGTPQSIAAMAQANSARDKMAQMGIDANKLFGSNVTLDQALKNFGGLGQNTLDKQRLNQQGDQWQQEFDQSQDKWDWEKNTKFPWEQSQWTSEFNLDKWYKESSVTNDNKRVDLEGRRIGIQEAADGADAATNNILGDLLNPDFNGKTRDQMVSWANDEMDGWKELGVDIKTVMDQINKYWPKDDSGDTAEDIKKRLEGK